MKKYVFAAVLACGLLAGAPAFADSHEAPGSLADLWIVHVKPDMGDQFEEAFKKHIKFRQSKGDPRTWHVYSPAVGAKLGYYAIRACCMKWEDLDAYGGWSQENGVGEHWNDNVHQYVAKYQHYIDELDFENSNWPEDLGPPAMVGVTRFYRKPGTAGAVDAARAKMSTIAKEGGWKRHWSWGDQVGGKDMFFLVTPYKNYAEMKPLDPGFVAFMAEQLGSEAEAGKVLEQFTSGVSYSTYTIYRRNEDLSMEEK